MGKLSYHGKYYGTMEGTMVLYRIHWNIDFRWKKTWKITQKYETLIYNGENFNIIPKQLRFFNKELQCYKNYDPMEKLWY